MGSCTVDHDQDHATDQTIRDVAQGAEISVQRSSASAEALELVGIFRFYIVAMGVGLAELRCVHSIDKSHSLNLHTENTERCHASSFGIQLAQTKIPSLTARYMTYDCDPVIVDK